MEFKWVKDGKDIESIPNTSVLRQAGFSVLTVGPASKDNVGNYTCVAENALGKDAHMSAFVLNGMIIKYRNISGKNKLDICFCLLYILKYLNFCSLLLFTLNSIFKVFSFFFLNIVS